MPSLSDSVTDLWSSAGALVSDLVTPTLRLGVTGLARSGKTVFITALVRNLVSGGRLPFFAPFAEGRLVSAHLRPQPDDEIPRFDYEAHIRALEQDPPVWPESTRRISELRVALTFSSEARLRRALGVRHLNLDIVDYPGEWLLDLALLGQDYAAWSKDAMRRAKKTHRAAAAEEWLRFATNLNPTAPASEQTALDGAKIFTRYLEKTRDGEPLTTLGPGRFLMPGDLEGSPLLTFFPLAIETDAQAARGSLAAMMARRYDSYVQHVVRPFFRDHFSRLDRQIVLVDTLGALNGGAETTAELQQALEEVMTAFRPGLPSWLAALLGARRIDRLLFAATKADHIHHTSHDRLEGILRLMTERAGARSRDAGAEVRIIALASLRATREAEARHGKSVLPCIVGVPLPGERLAGTAFDGRKEAAIFPGDLPDDPRQALEHGLNGAASFPRFRPPRLVGPSSAGEMAATPHIRLDRALDFLIGDWLA